MTVGFRPEAVVLSGEAGATAIPVSLDRVEFLGAEALVHVRANASGQPLIVRMSPKAAASAFRRNGAAPPRSIRRRRLCSTPRDGTSRARQPAREISNAA